MDEIFRQACLEISLTEADAAECKQLLNDYAFKGKLGELLRIEREKLDAIAIADLTTDTGVKAALKEQGYREGLARAIDILLETFDA